MEPHPIYRLAQRFPQLSIPLSSGARETPLYKELVLRGRKNDLPPAGYSLSDADELKGYPTPAGEAEVLFLRERADFERCVCALAYRCEPKTIPPSMGATTIRGLIDWGRIRARRAAYENAGGGAWQEEFRRFTADPDNYQATLILVSSGYYSAVPPEAVGLSTAEWRQRSLTIRTYHELTHFVCRRWYPGDIDPIRDEVIADAVGLLAAFGAYDPHKAKLFLGIEGESYRPGGRLENYVKDMPLDQAIRCADVWVRRVADTLAADRSEDPFWPLRPLMEADREEKRL